jgi:hypothetical protein
MLVKVDFLRCQILPSLLKLCLTHTVRMCFGLLINIFVQQMEIFLIFMETRVNVKEKFFFSVVKVDFFYVKLKQ